LGDARPLCNSDATPPFPDDLYDDAGMLTTAEKLEKVKDNIEYLQEKGLRALSDTERDC
jgi:hypothetical protein